MMLLHEPRFRIQHNVHKDSSMCCSSYSSSRCMQNANPPAQEQFQNLMVINKILHSSSWWIAVLDGQALPNIANLLPIARDAGQQHLLPIPRSIPIMTNRTCSSALVPYTGWLWPGSTSDFRSLEVLKLEGRLQLFQALLSESIPATVGCATWGVDCLTKPRSPARFEWQQGQTSVSGDTSRGIPELSRYMYRYPRKSQSLILPLG